MKEQPPKPKKEVKEGEEIVIPKGVDKRTYIPLYEFLRNEFPDKDDKGYVELTALLLKNKGKYNERTVKSFFTKEELNEAREIAGRYSKIIAKGIGKNLTTELAKELDKALRQERVENEGDKTKLEELREGALNKDPKKDDNNDVVNREQVKGALENWKKG